MDEQPFESSARAAWRSVMWPLDALKVPSPDDVGGSKSWRESWLDATSWWTDDLAEGPGTWPEASDRLFADLVEGLARTFRGRSIDVEVRGRRIRGTLDRLWLDSSTGQRAVRLELGEVAWNELTLQTVAIDTEAISFASSPAVALTVTGIRIEARSGIEAVVAWLDRRMPQRRLWIDADGCVMAASATGGMQFELDAVVVDDEMRIEVRGVRWRSRRLPVPSWLRLTRKAPLPALPAGARVSEARRQGNDVVVRLKIAEVTQKLDLARLREAMSRDEILPLD